MRRLSAFSLLFMLLLIGWSAFESAGGLTLARVTAGVVHRVDGAPVAARPAPQAPAEARPIAVGDMNVLLLGSDRRASGDPSWRTDTIMVAAIRPQDKLIALFSIPRDLWVTIPGYGEERINVADFYGESTNGPGGGPALLAATLEENLGISVHAYARINFEGLEKVIDALGGVTVTLEQPIDDTLDDPQGGMHVQLPKGTHHLDGRTALAFARSRKTTNDLDRCRRQQQILLGMREAASNPSVILQLPRLLLSLPDVVDTNLQPGQMLSLANLALHTNPASYRTRIVDETMVQDWVTPGGAMVLLPNRARIREAWRQLTTP